ncbi:MAG: ribonuclease P protein component [Proteobacteria bacterium]|nr:ribonuclease P protein component [Pseudomonadota bacterium]
MQRLTKHQRIRTRPEYGRVFNQSKKIHSPHFKLMVHWTMQDQPARLGLIISKKAAPRAVDRNRIKRLVRESFRCQESLKSADYVVMAKPSVKQLTNQQVLQSLQQLWQRI